MSTRQPGDTHRDTPTTRAVTVLVVDDSALVRRLVSRVLEEAEGISVVGTAANGELALRKIAELRPDLVTLDVEMPVMDGLATLREIRRRHPRLPVVMVSTLTGHGAAATVEALAQGASDYVCKPSSGASLAASLADVRDQLVPRVRALTARALPVGTRDRRTSSTAADGPGTPALLRPAAEVDPVPQVLAVGSSTGGPEALTRLFGALTAALPVPVVVVQHMPPVFTQMLAGRLDRLGPATVVEAQHGQLLQPGVVYLAPGGRHLEVHRRAGAVRTVLHDRAPESYSRPSVDVLFGSVAAAYPGSALAVVLTGMGQDGRRGARLLVESGSQVVAQDAASSVVWGMPRAVVEAGLAREVLGLDQIAPYLLGRLSRPAARRVPAAATVGTSR
ncbi:chemotaxis response regulator protein-glutamate methylesterase [Rhodococcus sp. X156]|uniref:protein-glutamate methylesterase/protein-glutamine glutaminase n=1 Tax=Rhodococcus sp. X156 TaxID=2499145 RepID=UPI000FD6E1A9|nr:chemotaxis response regulator protein-glutamate methylesterase [Rhodococcus sp. X156]